MITSRLISLIIYVTFQCVYVGRTQNHSIFFYKHFEGTINHTYKIQMDLKYMRVPYDGDSTARFEGTYFYESKGILLSLIGRYEQDMIELEAFSSQGSEASEKFVGQLAEDGVFRGKWQFQSKTFPFELKETYVNGSVPFLPITHTFNGKTFPSKKVSPTVSVYQEFFLPLQYKNVVTLKFLRDSLLHYNNLKTRIYTEKAIQTDMANQAKKYVTQAREETVTEQANGNFDDKEEAMFQYNRDLSKSVQVVFNTTNLLSIGFSLYEYTGGAHGMYGVTYKVYDLLSKKHITLKHLFKPGTEVALKALLIDYAKQNYSLTAAQKLTEAGFFENTLPLTSNFYLTHKTVTFTYMPYEVAPYAMGMVSVTIPYEKLKPLLKENSPLHRFWIEK